MSNIFSSTKTMFRPILFGILMLAFTLVPLLSMRQASATAYFCGSQCNGKSPTWVIPANGIVCANSASVIAQGNPSGEFIHPKFGEITVTDTKLSVKVMYSSVCQTMWAVVTTTQAIGRTSCAGYLTRTINPNWNGVYSCPGSGTSAATGMVDDHDPNLGIAADYTLYESYPYAGDPDLGTVNASFSKSY